MNDDDDDDGDNGDYGDYGDGDRDSRYWSLNGNCGVNRPLLETDFISLGPG